jgi:hypothetical protein
MQDEELDKLINDAANQHHPPYDDTSWVKMEQLLDKHLPLKKDSRKFIFWLLLFLLAGGGATLGILQPWKKTPPETSIAKNANEKKPAFTTAKKNMPPVDNNGRVTNTIATNTLAKQSAGNVTKAIVGNNGNGTVANNTATAPLTIQKNGLVAKTTADNTGEKIMPITKTATAQKNILQLAYNKKNGYKTKSRFSIKVKKTATTANIENDAAMQKASPAQNDGTNNTNFLLDTQKQNDIAIKADSTNKTSAEKQKNELVKKAPVQQKQKTDKRFANNFAITLSAGTDVSYVSINKTGRLKPFYGAGLRYNLGRRFTVNAGLLVSRKIYTAAPGQYKFPTGGSTRPNLVQINADCKIYEIPFLVYYNFKPVKNHNWFGGVGLSSFIMKNETYDYQYKTYAGLTWNYVRKVNNENEHYFAVLTLTGGYQYKINNRLLFMVQPYLELPLKGIGYGTVKLHSTGLLLTAAVKPFAKNR